MSAMNVQSARGLTARIATLALRLTLLVGLLAVLGVRAVETHTHDGNLPHDPSCLACRVLDAPLSTPPPVDVLLRPVQPDDHAARVLEPRSLAPETPELGTRSVRGPPIA
jgi:hypothetical protein